MTITDTVRDIARVSGEDVATIRVKSVDWGELLQAGVVVDTHVGRWRAVAQITLEDLGITITSAEERAARERTLTLGWRHLLPKATMAEAQRIDRKRRSTLEDWSIRTFWGRFVPASRYRAWKAEDDALQRQYFKLADEIVDEWDDLVDRMRQDFATVARDNYRRLRADGAELERTEDAYVGWFVEHMLGKLETPEAARASWKWTQDTSFVPLTPGTSESSTSLPSDPMLRDLAATAARREAGGLAQFAADLQSEIRGLVYNVTLNALEAAKDNGGKLERNSTAALKRLVEAVDRLKFWPDDALEGRLAELQALVSVKSDKRSDADVKAALEALAAESRMLLLTIDRPPARSGRAVGIPDDIDDLAIKIEARHARALELTDDVLGTGLTDADLPAGLAARAPRSVVL